MAFTFSHGILSRYTNFTPRDARADELRGRRDGERDFPAEGAKDFSPYELQIIGEGTTVLTRYYKEIDSEFARNQEEVSRREYERDELYHKRRHSLLGDKEDALSIIRSKYGPDSPRVSNLRAKLSEKSNNLRRLDVQLARPLRVHFQYTYPFFLALLCVAEVPINKLAFEFFFKEAPIVALGIAFMVGVLFIALAHICGIWLRQADHYPKLSGTILAYLATAVLIAIVFCLIYFIAALRQQLVDFIEQEQSFRLSDFLQQGGLGRVAERTTEVSLGTASLTLLFINIGIFTLGTVLSFLRHDPHPDYEHLVRDQKRTEQRLERIQRRFDRNIGTVEKDFGSRLSHLDVELDRTERDIAELIKRRDTLDKQREEAVKLVVQVSRQRLLAYQAGNSQTRMSPPPAYFGEGHLAEVKRRIVSS